MCAGTFSRSDLFRIRLLDGMGVFPGWGRPRVLWVGVGEGGEGLKRLASLVEGAMEKEGFKKEGRRFVPHVTIGRVRSQRNTKSLKEAMDAFSVEPRISQISNVIVFKSDLTPSGAVHTPLYTSFLGR